MSRETLVEARDRVSPEGGVFVGRDTEVRRLESMLGEHRPRVLFLHGLAGSGKSSLLRHFARSVSSHGDAAVFVLDCREIEPTEQGFSSGLSLALDHDSPGAMLEIPMRLARVARRVVICLDHYEVFRLLDSWLRNQFVPSLPEKVSLLMAGRQEPNPAWTRLPAGTFEVMRLGSLGPEESTDLVRAMQVGEDAVEAIVGFADGHPLTLILGALAARERSTDDIRDVTMDRLLDEFTVAYLDDLSEEAERLLGAASVVRRVSAPLLGAMLPEIDAWKGFDSLRRLPFVAVTSDGLALHEALQKSISARLRAAVPSRHRELRRRAWSYFREQLRTVPRAELWRSTADMIYLLENPAVREAHFPTSVHRFAIETASSADGKAIDQVIVRHEPDEAVKLLRSWWARCPETFKVARDTRGEVVGFSILTTQVQTDLKSFEYDPVAAVWLDHLRNDPVGPGQQALLLRRWLTLGQGDEPSEAQASLWLDLKRTYMELRPRLRRIYSTTDHPEIYGPVLGQLGATPINPVVEIDGRKYQQFCLDFGPSSVDGWLTRIAAQELGIHDDGLLDVLQRQLLVNGHRIDLTPKEFAVMAHLSERPGEPVGRLELLASIWGYDDPVGSNVVDAVVYTLRKKLGSEAWLLETVRGIGYRLAAH